MTRSAAIAVYASIVSAARVTIARSAASAKTVWMPSVSAVTDAQTVQRFVRTAVKNAKTVRTGSAVPAVFVTTVSAVRGITAITATNVNTA